MILDVFPSYKDKDMVDTLYRYERDTRLSINILVENFLEELLYKEGYLTVEIDDKESQDGLNFRRLDNFSTKSQHGNIRLYYNELDFSSHPSKLIDEIKSKLLEYSDDELEKLSVNNWEGNRKKYKEKLYNKLNISFDDDEDNNKKYITYNKRDDKWRVGKWIKSKSIHFGGYDTFEDAKKVRDFLVLKNWNPKYYPQNVNLNGGVYSEYILSEVDKEVSV